MRQRLRTAARPRVSVLVVAARKPGNLRSCLTALARNVPEAPAWELVLVLNPGEPEVEAVAREEFSGFVVEWSAVDLGLAGGLNRARALASGELLVALHDDAEVEPGWLEALLAAAARHPEAGALGSYALHPDGSPQMMGGVLWRDGTTTLPFDASRLPTEVTAVDYCGTFSLLIRAATWDAIGGASEEFFPAVYVDVDLAMRIWGRGQAVLGIPGSRVRHQRSASTGPELRRFLFDRNRRRFRAKWESELEARPAPSPDLGAALTAALASAAERWRSCRAAAPPDEPDAGPAPLDVAAQERRHLELAAALDRDWAAELARGLADARAAIERHAGTLRAQEQEIAALAEARRALTSERDALRAELRTLTSLAWWRIYRFLLPLLRRLRGARGDG
jgi:GT2 family glycosyltransferase